MLKQKQASTGECCYWWGRDSKEIDVWFSGQCMSNSGNYAFCYSNVQWGESPNALKRHPAKGILKKYYLWCLYLYLIMTIS